jgi:phosphoglycolate phosphatase
MTDLNSYTAIHRTSVKLNNTRKETMDNCTSIIWDWNGTLLDDVDICIESINFSLGKRNLPMLTKERYREIFTFPVIDYYEKAGFDFSKNSFDELSHEFIERYLDKLKGVHLFQDVEDTLLEFNKKGCRQFILSAMEQTTLMDSVRQFNIEKYFSRIQGTGDIYAYGKLHNAKILMETSGLDPVTTCLIGDTLHDLEVARQLTCHCLLISSGHQSHKRLQKEYPLVAHSMKEVVLLCK